MTFLNVAVTKRAWFIVTSQSPMPEQPSPLQPVNVEFAFAAAKHHLGAEGEVGRAC